MDSLIKFTPESLKHNDAFIDHLLSIIDTKLQFIEYRTSKVIKSAAKIDHAKTGGTLLNQKFTPQLLQDEDGIQKLSDLIRTYFKLDGHHIQFNVVDVNTLRNAQKYPNQYRDLIVRVAGYSDYFCDLGEALQEEIITRTEHSNF